MKQSKLAFLFLSFLLTVVFLNGQNKVEYFKIYPIADTDIPEWAELMYSEDPNVYEVEKKYNDYYKTHDFIKNDHTRNYKYWMMEIYASIDSEGKIRPKDDFVVRDKSLNRGSNSMWQPVGPFIIKNRHSYFSNSDDFLVNVYTVDQSPVDTNRLIAGVERGGLYLSMDKGSTWTHTQASFDQGLTHITAAEWDPVDPNTFYFFSNRYLNKAFYKSTDLGITVTKCNVSMGIVHDIAISSSNNQLLLVAASKGIFRSTDGGQNWTSVSQPYKSYDVEFHPTNNSICYAMLSDRDTSYKVTTRSRHYFYKSIDSGLTWTQKDISYPGYDTNASLVAGGKIGITEADPNYVYVAISDRIKQNQNYINGVHICKSTDAGETWTTSPNNRVSTNPQGMFCMDIGVSSQDPETIWIGGKHLYKSTDGGSNFSGIFYRNIHPDIQDISVQGQDIIVSTDGGMIYSNDELQTKQFIQDGINGSLFFGFGSGWNKDVLVGGRFHSGNALYYEDYPDHTFIRTGGYEDATGYVDPLDNLVVRTHDQGSFLVPTSLNGPIQNVLHFSKMPSVSTLNNRSSEIFYDVEYRDWVYIGVDDTIFKSGDNGKNFIPLKTFGNSYVLGFDQSRENPDILYVVVRNDSKPNTLKTELWKSTDRGIKWNQLDVSMLSDRTYLHVTVAQDDANKIVVLGNGSTVNALKSIDGGLTWTDISDSTITSDKRITDIFSQPTNNGLVVYAAANGTVFKYSEHFDSWDFFDNGLGFMMGPKIRPFYRDSKIRIAGWGYGIYETTFPEETKTLPQPYTSRPTIECASSPIRFDSYSIADLQNATIQWEFNPPVDSIFMVENRAVDVVFNQGGLYDVTLNIENDNGVFSKTIENMVYVVEGCNENLDSDGDGIPNYLDGDLDGDGLPNIAEKKMEEYYGYNVDLDFIPEQYDLDSDDDGAHDNIEEGNDCRYKLPKTIHTEISSKSDTLICDFNGQTEGLNLLNIKVHFYSAGQRWQSEIFLLVDLSNESINNMGYCQYYPPCNGMYDTPVIIESSTEIQTPEDFPFIYKLINKKLYVSSYPDLGLLDTITVCTVRGDLNQNGILDYREAGITLPVDIISLTALKQENYNELVFGINGAANVTGLEIQKASDSKVWSRLSWIESSDIVEGDEMKFKDYDILKHPSSLYRIAIHHHDGTISYSPISSILRSDEDLITLVSNQVSDNIIVDFKNELSTYHVALISSDGKVLNEWERSVDSSLENFNVSDVSKGFYILRIVDKSSNQNYQFKVFIR